jgi:hypothetical protein
MVQSVQSSSNTEAEYSRTTPFSEIKSLLNPRKKYTDTLTLGNTGVFS